MNQICSLFPFVKATAFAANRCQAARKGYTASMLDSFQNPELDD